MSTRSAIASSRAIGKPVRRLYQYLLPKNDRKKVHNIVFSTAKVVSLKQIGTTFYAFWMPATFKINRFNQIGNVTRSLTSYTYIARIG